MQTDVLISYLQERIETITHELETLESLVPELPSEVRQEIELDLLRLRIKCDRGSIGVNPSVSRKWRSQKNSKKTAPRLGGLFPAGCA